MNNIVLAQLKNENKQLPTQQNLKQFHKLKKKIIGT